MKKIGLCLFFCLWIGIIPVFSSTIAYPPQMVENTLFFLGSYEGKPISWILLGNSQEDAALAVCQYVFDEQPFDASGNTDYAQSDLRTYLDGTFYSKVFSPAEKKLIVTKETPDTEITDWLNPYPLPKNQNFHVFPLSATQARDILGKYSTLSGISFRDGSNAGYWLRSPHQSIQTACGIVQSDNTISHAGIKTKQGVRPAFYIDFSSVVFVRKALDEDYGPIGLVTKSDFNRSAEYKFSLLSDTLAFSVKEVAYDPNGKISVTYENATVEDNTYLSAIIVNFSNDVRGYGRLGELKKSNGTFVGTCDFDFTRGDYEIRFFLEQPGDNGMPDYVTHPQSHSVTIREIEAPIPFWFWFIPGGTIVAFLITLFWRKKFWRKKKTQ